jgi:hypothetical protein
MDSISGICCHSGDSMTRSRCTGDNGIKAATLVISSSVVALVKTTQVVELVMTASVVASLPVLRVHKCMI